MALNTRRLGTTDLEITTVGFGAWAIGGSGWAYGWGPQDDVGSIAAMVPSLAIRRPGYLEDRHEPTMFAMRDLRKDLDLALVAFHRVDAHVPITALVREWIDEAAATDPDLDVSAVIRRYAHGRVADVVAFGRPNGGPEAVAAERMP